MSLPPPAPSRRTIHVRVNDFADAHLQTYYPWSQNIMNVKRRRVGLKLAVR